MNSVIICNIFIWHLYYTINIKYKIDWTPPLCHFLAVTSPALWRHRPTHNPLTSQQVPAEMGSEVIADALSLWTISSSRWTALWPAPSQRLETWKKSRIAWLTLCPQGCTAVASSPHPAPTDTSICSYSWRFYPKWLQMRNNTFLLPSCFA